MLNEIGHENFFSLSFQSIYGSPRQLTLQDITGAHGKALFNNDRKKLPHIIKKGKR
jgi:hypothetical protein